MTVRQGIADCGSLMIKLKFKFLSFLVKGSKGKSKKSPLQTTSMIFQNLKGKKSSSPLETVDNLLKDDQPSKIDWPFMFLMDTAIYT